MSAEEVTRVQGEYETATSEFRSREPEIANSVREARFAPAALPETRPALREVLLDDLGQIWVSRFMPSNAEWQQADSWHVLDRTATPVARIELPENSWLTAVMSDRIAIVVRDSLDVEHVRVHRLSVRHP